MRPPHCARAHLDTPHTHIEKMADLNEFSAGPIATGIIQWYEKRGAAPAPAYLEASTAGGPCDRALWYAHRFCEKRQETGAAVRLADGAERSRARFMFELRQLGVDVLDRDPESRAPFFFDDLDGHFGTVMHACAEHVLGGGNQWHAVEFATLPPDVFVRAKEKGAEAACPEAYDKLQLIMGWSGMTRALFLAESTFSGDVFAERIAADPVYFERLRARASSIIRAGEPPAKLHQDPTEETCRACAAHDACHGTRVPAVSCRTCCYSTPEQAGSARWSCCHPSKPRGDLALDIQRTGCEDHLVLPFLVNYAEPIESGDSGWILFRHRETDRHFIVVSATAMPPVELHAEYDEPALYQSAELSAAHDCRMIGNPEVEKLRAEFAGRIVA